MVPLEENELASDKGMIGSVGDFCGLSLGVLGELLPTITSCCRVAASDVAARVSDDTVSGDVHSFESCSLGSS